MADSAELPTGRWRGPGVYLSLALLAGRIAGLLREMKLADVFGVSPDADYAVLLLTLPDLLVNVALSGGLSGALVPSLKRLGGVLAAAQFRRVSTFVGLGFGLIGFVLATTPQTILGLLAPGLVIPATAISTVSFAAVSLAIPLTALSGVSSAYLNARDRFFAAGCGTLIFNLCVLTSLQTGDAFGRPLPVLCGGILLGAIVRWGVQLAILPRETWTLRGRSWHLDATFAKGFVAAAASASLMLVVPLLVRAAASLIGPGNIALFNYATKIVELPAGILITAVSVVALPRLSGLYSSLDRDSARRVAIRETRRAVLLSIAVLIPAWWFADSIVAVLFDRGQMTSTSVARIVELTRIALIGLPCIALSSMAATDLYAQGRSGVVLRATLICLCLLPVLCIVGLYLSSARWLMTAVVAFQALLALLLARSASMQTFGDAGWFDAQMIRSLAQTALLSSLVICSVWMSGVSSPLVRVVFAGVTFALGAWSGTWRHDSANTRDAHQHRLKRILDIVIAIGALLLVWPIMLVVAASVYFSDRGPIIFRQTRIGVGGRNFVLFKFRSMVLDAERLGDYSTVDGDRRITRVGRFIRRTSLDELPQIVNVINGDMSMVGPRPDVPAQKSLYSDFEWQLRHTVRPGITGLAQATLRSAATPLERKKLDLHYVRNQSMKLDCQILMLTLKQVFGKGGN